MFWSANYKQIDHMRKSRINIFHNTKNNVKTLLLLFLWDIHKCFYFIIYVYIHKPNYLIYIYFYFYFYKISYYKINLF